MQIPVGVRLDGLTVAVPDLGQVALPLAGFLAVLHHIGHPGCRRDGDLGERLLGVIQVNRQDHLRGGRHKIDTLTSTRPQFWQPGNR